VNSSWLVSVSGGPETGYWLCEVAELGVVSGSLGAHRFLAILRDSCSSEYPSKFLSQRLHRRGHEVSSPHHDSVFSSDLTAVWQCVLLLTL